MARRAGHYVLAVVLASVGLAAPKGDIHVAADTNGDAQVDVRDLQLVIGECLGTPQEELQAALDAVDAKRADVNGDGRVDVLDVQCIVHACGGKGSAPAPRPDTETGVVPSRTLHEVTPVGAVRISRPTYATSKAHRSRPAAENICPTASARTDRYVLCLVPHAPPLRA